LRPHQDIHARLLAQQILAATLGQTSCHHHHNSRITRFQSARRTQMPHKAGVGLFAHGAGVVDEETRPFRLRHPAQALGVQHPMDALGIVLVHLATEGAQVEGGASQQVAQPIPPRSGRVGGRHCERRLGR